MALEQTVNIYLKAKSEKGLIRKQLINNAVNHVKYNYTTPVWTGKNWVIWFFADIEEWKDPEQIKDLNLELLGIK